MIMTTKQSARTTIWKLPTPRSSMNLATSSFLFNFSSLSTECPCGACTSIQERGRATSQHPGCRNLGGFVKCDALEAWLERGLPHGFPFPGQIDQSAGITHHALPA